MFNIKKIFFILICFALIFCACSRKGSDTADTSSIDYLNTFLPQWYIYQEFVNVSDGNIEVISFNNTSSVTVGVVEGNNKYISVNWDGNPTTLYGGESAGTYTDSYGFYFAFDTNKDLSGAAYTKLKFDVKGSIEFETYLLVTLNNLEGSSDDVSLTVNPDDISVNTYTTFEIAVGNLSSVKEIVEFVLKSESGKGLSCGGAKIAIDNIRFERS